MKINRYAIKDVIISLAVFPVAFIIARLLIRLLLPSFTNEFLLAASAEGIFAIVIFLITLLLRKTEIYSFDHEKFESNWSCGSYFIVMILISVNTSVILGNQITEPLGNLILFALEMLLVGFCEETVFRALVQRSFHVLFGEESLAAVRLAVFVSCLFFSLIHILNARSANISMKAALIQTLMTIVLGMCFGAIYFRTGKCLWYVIILHALNDASAYIAANRLGGASATDPISAYEDLRPMQIAFPLMLYVGLALFLMRKKKIEPLLDKAS